MAPAPSPPTQSSLVMYSRPQSTLGPMSRCLVQDNEVAVQDLSGQPPAEDLTCLQQLAVFWGLSWNDLSQL